MAIQLQQLGETLYATSSFGVVATAPHTLMCWLNANGGTWNGTPGVRSMCGLYSSSNIAGGAGVASQIGTRGSGNIDVWDWGGNVIVSTGGTGYTPPLATWIHVTFSYDGTNGRIYINGVLNNTTVFAKAAGTFNMFFINGYINGVTAETSQFEIDETMAFNRQLSDNEILSIYNTRGARDGAAYGLMGRFSFDELYTGSYVASNRDESAYLQDIYPQNNTAVPQPGGTGWTLGGGMTVTLNATMAPDSSVSASLLTFTAAGASAISPTDVTTAATTSYTSVIYFNPNGSTGTIYVGMADNTFANYSVAIVNLGTALVTGTTQGGACGAPTYVLTKLPGGWWVIYVTSLVSTAGVALCTGVESVGGTGSFYAWDADVVPTSYLATYLPSAASPSDTRPVQI